MPAHATDDQVLDGTRILANARAVAPELRAEAAANEELRRLSDRTVRALRSTGVFRMAMPREWGGPEVDPVTQCEILEELSAADGSAGWCASIGSDSGFYSAGLTEDAGRRLYPDLDMVTAGWVAPSGTLHERDGGYLLEGRWQFGSGCTHADVILGGAMVHRDGEPLRTPDGAVETRMALLPAGEFEIVDTWRTTGLAGSGSHDYRTDGVFVPRDQTFQLPDIATGPRHGALYAWPGMFALNLAAVPLGIARAAVADAEEVLRGKTAQPMNTPAVEDPRIRHGVALAHARVGSARAYWYQELDALWSVLREGGRPSTRRRAAVPAAAAFAIRTCRDAVRDLADVVGTASIRRTNPLEQRLRDLTTIAQHVLAQDAVLELCGALWLGADRVHENHPWTRSGFF